MRFVFNSLSLRRNIVSMLSLVLITVVFFWRVPVQGAVLLPLDVLYTYEPWRSEVPGALGKHPWNPWLSDGVRHTYPILTVVRSSWQGGQTPFWNPYSLAGMHVLASGINSVFYPITVTLLLLMAPAYAISWATVLHTFLGALFCYLFIRELGAAQFAALLGAVTFGFGASLVYWMPFLGSFQPIIWLPLLFLTLERAIKREDWRWALAGGVVLLFQILAGNIQVAYYSLTGLGLYTVYRAGLKWVTDRDWLEATWILFYLFLLVITGLSLAALQLLPILELLPQGARSQINTDFEFANKVLLRLLVPDILGTDIDGNIAPGFTHDIYLYFGILPLFFLVASAFSPNREMALGMFGLGLLVILVVFKVPPFYQLFAAFYPTFEVLGFYRALFLTAFFWSVAIGLGADWIVRTRPAPMLRRLLLLGGAVLTGLAGYVLWLAFASKYQARSLWPAPSVESLDPPALYLLSTLIFSLAILGTGLALLWYWQQARISRTVFAATTLGLVIIDLFLAHIDYVPPADPAMLYPTTPSLEFIREVAARESQPYRIAPVDRLLWSNISTVFQLPGIQGYDPFLTTRYSQYLDLSGTRLETNHRIAAFEAKTSRLIDALNVKYYYIPRYKLVEGDWISLLDQLDKPVVESEHIYAGQTGEWIVAGWPQRSLLAPTPSRISYRGFLDYPAHIETAIAIDPEAWTRPGAEVLFEVYGRSIARDDTILLFSKTLAQVDQPDQMAWEHVVIDLKQFTNQEVVVSFVTSSTSGTKWDAAWAEPLLMDRTKVELLHYGPNSIYLNKNYLPRAWPVHQVTEVSEGDLEAVKAALTQPAFDPAQEAVIEGDMPEPILPATTGEHTEIVHYSPSHIVAQANLSAPGLLVMSDIYAPGWRVFVDDVQQTLFATNLTMRGVFVPAGEHEIEFIYEPLSFRLGLYISLGASLIIISVIAITFVSRKKF